MPGPCGWGEPAGVAGGVPGVAVQAGAPNTALVGPQTAPNVFVPVTLIAPGVEGPNVVA